MNQEKKLEGCIRAHLKPGQELPEPLSDAELAKAVQEGKVLAVVNGKRVGLISSAAGRLRWRWMSSGCATANLPLSAKRPAALSVRHYRKLSLSPTTRWCRSWRAKRYAGR